MVGQKNGLAGLLHREFPKLLTFHCVCHRLALATVDSCNETKYIEEVHNHLRQVWQLLENSPKKMAIFIKIQAHVNGLNLSELGKQQIATKLQKACKTRWLSFESSVSSVIKCLYPLLLNLKDSATAGGLYKKMYNCKFIGAIYMLHEILPILSILSKTYQKGTAKGSVYQADKI